MNIIKMGENVFEAIFAVCPFCGTQVIVEPDDVVSLPINDDLTIPMWICPKDDCGMAVVLAGSSINADEIDVPDDEYEEDGVYEDDEEDEEDEEEYEDPRACRDISEDEYDDQEEEPEEEEPPEKPVCRVCGRPVPPGRDICWNCENKGKYERQEPQVKTRLKVDLENGPKCQICGRPVPPGRDICWNCMKEQEQDQGQE